MLWCLLVQIVCRVSSAGLVLWGCSAHATCMSVCTCNYLYLLHVQPIRQAHHHVPCVHLLVSSGSDMLTRL